MGGQTISQSDTKIEALTLQSSTYGAAITVAYGVTRIAGNMLWYGGFKAIPHTSTEAGGGKGGGVKTQRTTYSYEAAIMMALCEGPISGVGTIWRGKNVYSGGISATQVVTANATKSSNQQYLTLPIPPGAVFSTVTQAYYSEGGDGGSGYVGEGEGGYIRTGNVLDFGAGTFFFYQGVNVEYQYLIPGTQQTSLQQLNLSFASGQLAQPVWSYLTDNYPSYALGYSGIAYVYSGAYDLGTTASVENHNFEVVANMAYSIGSTVPDADPALVEYDLLTNYKYGVGFATRLIGDTNLWSSYCRAASLLLSPAISDQRSAADVTTQMAKLTNTAIVWSEGKLKFIPYGDTPLSANGATYTPNTTAIYDLTLDDFLDKDWPVRSKRKSNTEAWNHIRVEFKNRLNQYNIEIAEAKDQANIDTYGLRSASVLEAHWCCDPDVARRIAQILLQRALYIRNTYTFKLNFTKALLEPMDLVTITDSQLRLDKYPVRITEIGEGDSEFTVTAEDFPLGVATGTLYPNQSGIGFSHNYNVAPGPVDAPIIFEAPVELTTTGLEVYAAVRGSGQYWGGCRVWVSVDGNNYQQVAKLDGGSRLGALTGPIAGGTMPVGGLGNAQLISGSAADAAAYGTLSFVGGAVKEYFAYTTAALTGPGAYNLSGLVRGIYGTSSASAHAAADPYVRVDQAIAKSGPLDLSKIGDTIFFKFTSFNYYGGGEESVADVPEYSYIITGYMAQLPPSTPTGFTASNEPFGIRLAVNKNPEPDVRGYQYRVGATWDTAVVLEPLGGTSYLYQVQALGSYTFWVAAVDALNNFSTPVSTTASIGAGAITGLISSFTGINLNLAWTAGTGSFATAGYEVRYGATWATATVAQFVQSNRYAENVKWGSSRTYWVALVDVKGNYGTPVSLVVSVAPPGPVLSQYSTVVDNNVLLYWSPPITGTLPVDRYEVRKGTTWAGGTTVGSNGNSTFTAIFEQQAGVYTYWVNAYDSAGNAGTPVDITATVSQPPDYILRNDYNSPLNGTLVNMYKEGSVLIGPTDLTQTWATHFSSNSWTSPADQIAAGFPIYIEPSATSGSYEEVIDYGAVLPATIITTTLSATVLHGAVVATPIISFKTAIGDPWTSAPAGQPQVFVAGGFRYVRIHYDFTCTAGANVIVVSGLNVKLSLKLKTDSGAGTITTAATGLVVNFNVAFIAADTPIVQPTGTTPLIPVVDFAGTPYPTSFTVYLYTLAGVKTTGSFSWTSRGY